jgi:hypothetical protein
MQFSLEIPDDMASALTPEGESLSRAALEALALEGYRTQRLSESQICSLLGFETRMQVHAFLKAHNSYLNYTLDDLDRDRQVSERLRTQRRAIPPKPGSPGPSPSRTWDVRCPTP